MTDPSCGLTETGTEIESKDIPVEPKFAFICLLHTSYLYCISLFRISCSSVPVTI